MKRSGRLIWAGGCLSALAAAGIAFANEDARPRQLWVNAPITVDAEGRASIGKIDGAQGPLAQAAHEQLIKARYLPARRNGVAVASSTHLTATMVLTPVEGDKYSIGLGAITLAPLSMKIAPPSYPVEMVRRGRSGFVELRLRIGIDGKVTVLRTVAASDAAFEKVAVESVEHWLFVPQTVEGVPTDFEVSQSFWFSGESKRRRAEFEGLPTFLCDMNESSPRWEKQVGCLNRMEIGFSQVRASQGPRGIRRAQH